MHISILLMEQIIQLFLMIFMGFLIVKAKLLNSEDSKILSIIVLYLIIPCVIINAFQVDYTMDTVKGLLLALAASVMTQVLLLIIISISGKLLHLNEVELLLFIILIQEIWSYPLWPLFLDRTGFYMDVFLWVCNLSFCGHTAKRLSAGNLPTTGKRLC